MVTLMKSSGERLLRTIEAGAIGCNLEDSFPETGHLRELAEQVARVTWPRAAADRLGVRYFINARADVFFQRSSEEHNDIMREAAIDRALAYGDAGADGEVANGWEMGL